MPVGNVMRRTVFFGIVLLFQRSVLAQTTENWYSTPFFGQNLPPEGDEPINVYFSTYLWRVIDVNEVAYQFTAQAQYTLSWNDPSAVELIRNATIRQREAGMPCTRPCNNYNFPAGNPSVTAPVLDTSAKCCDDLWLPGLLIENVVEYSASTYYSRIAPCNQANDLVWTVKFMATFYTSMDFRAFPFDKCEGELWCGTKYTQALDPSCMCALHKPKQTTHRQYLTILFQPPRDTTTMQGRVNIIPSTAAITTRFNSDVEQGDQLSSFYIKNMTFDVFEKPWSQVFQTTSNTAANDSCSFGHNADDDDQEFLSANYTSISVVIVVQRFSLYYVSTILLPVLCVGMFSGFVLIFNPNDLVTRFSSIITLFLALMAVQYVVNAELPASSYTMPSQQLILATYALYFALAIESFAVYKIVLTRERQEAEAKQAEAVEAWRQLQAQQAAEKATLSQYIGMMRSKQSGSAWSLRSMMHPSSVQNLDNPDSNVQPSAETTNTNTDTVVQVASDTSIDPEPRRASVVRFAPDPVVAHGSQPSVGSEEDRGVPEQHAPEGATTSSVPIGKGWSALRNKHPQQVAAAAAQPVDDLDTINPMPGPRNPSAASLPSMASSPNGDAMWEAQDSAWARPSWLRRRSTTSMSVATSRDAQDDTGQVVGLLGWLRKDKGKKKKKKSKRHTVQDVFYQWRARRFDKIFGSVIFCMYIITAVLLFAIPYALYTVPEHT